VYAVNVSTTFWIFTVLLLLGLIFVVFAMPETRGKSLDEIQIELGADPPMPITMTPTTPMSPPMTPDENNPDGSKRHHYYHHRHTSHHRSTTDSPNPKQTE
jgi:Sugar (and other) transporter